MFLTNLVISVDVLDAGGTSMHLTEQLKRLPVDTTSFSNANEIHESSKHLINKPVTGNLKKNKLKTSPVDVQKLVKQAKEKRPDSSKKSLFNLLDSGIFNNILSYC